MIMKLRHYFIAVLWICLSVANAKATTVIPPTFNQLVADAEFIFQGKVTDSHSFWTGEGAQQCIVTDVSFRVEEAIKGVPGNVYTIRMLGGTVAGTTMAVSDAPTFKVGDREILFVQHNGTQFIPLVGIMHGRFHLETDAAGRETVRKGSAQSLANVDKLGIDERGAVIGPALSAADFKAAIREKLTK